MANPRIATLLPFLCALGIAGCGSALEVPQELPVTSYPAGQAFRMTLVMATCSDSCATYSDPECSVDVVDEDKTIEVSAMLSYERTAETCTEQCGPPVIVHCEVPALSAGEYTVQSGKFSRSITVR